jgi:hypothetical protein
MVPNHTELYVKIHYKSTLPGQIGNAEKFTHVMVKNCTRIIHREIKKGLLTMVFVYSLLCKPINYNRLLELFL